MYGLPFPRDTKRFGMTHKGESLTAGQEVTTNQNSPVWPASNQDASCSAADVEASILDIADMGDVHEKQERLQERPAGITPGDRDDHPDRR